MNPQTVPRQLVPQQQTVNYFEAVQGPLRAINDGVLGRTTTSLGRAVVQTTPLSVASKMWRKGRVQASAAPRGVGEFADPMVTVALLALGYIVITGALSYQAGKAMAPNSRERKTWGWVGVPVGVLTGPWGLGVMGIVSNSSRRG